jgi:nitrite reductase/ring-hydroxylating ferredoxin subunit
MQANFTSRCLQPPATSGLLLNSLHDWSLLPDQQSVSATTLIDPPAPTLAGKPRCLDNLCPHRGAPLGRGWVKEVEVQEEGKGGAHASTHTCVVCPYHGWAFSGEGECMDRVPKGASSLYHTRVFQ